MSFARIIKPSVRFLADAAKSPINRPSPTPNTVEIKESPIIDRPPFRKRE